MMRQRPSFSSEENVLRYERHQVYQQPVRRHLRHHLKENIKPVLLGVILIFAGCILLFWNEATAVSVSRALDEGYNAVTKISDPSTVLKENEGKLIHICGTLSIPIPLKDDYFGIRVRATQLKRRVQMYQWVEEESLPSEEVTYPGSEHSYYYSQMWKDKLIDSNSFYIPYGHENPITQPIESIIQVSNIVKIGAYHLSPLVKKEFNKYVPVSSDEQPDVENMKLHNGMYYLSQDIFNLQIGDIRVQFYFAGHEGELVSLVGKQVGESIHPYVTSSGKELLILRFGRLSHDDMFSSEHARNRFSTWLYRLGGWFLIFLGMTALSDVIHHFAVMSSFIRDIISLGVGSANLTLSMSLSLLLIGGAWCFYRPGMAFFILVGATLPLFRALFNARNREV